MKLRRLLSLATALLLVASLPLAVLADEWDLSQGDITVSINGQGEQHVEQNWGNGSKVSQDSNPTITGGDGSQTITVNAKGDAEAKLTIEDIHAKTIEVGDSNATITVEGNNTVNNTDGAGIHVSSGDLTITGDGTLEAKGGFFSSAIGSKESEAMSGSITIEDNAKVTGTGLFGAAGIGSGDGGEMSGDITIEDNAQVEASATTGAGIGSGSAFPNANAMSGTITIGGTADVTATASNWASPGAGIGSGRMGEMSGTISISDKATVNASSTSEGIHGEAIGAGAGGSKTGTIEYFDPDPAPTQPEAESTAVYQVLNEDVSPWATPPR